MYDRVSFSIYNVISSLIAVDSHVINFTPIVYHIVSYQRNQYNRDSRV